MFKVIDYAALNSTAKSEIHICSNKHETGIVLALQWAFDSHEVM